MLQLQASDPLPGRRVHNNTDWAGIQLAIQAGSTLAPLLPLGADSGYVWIPKNGCTSLKRAWLQVQRRAPSSPDDHDSVHAQVQPHTHWLTAEELKAVAAHRGLVAVWRDPIDRFVSACRSHLQELTAGAIQRKLGLSSGDDASLLAKAVAWHHDLFRREGVVPFADNIDPVEAMNQVALKQNAWLRCHIDWSHHTTPQVSYLGGDPRAYRTILGMDQIQVLIEHWSSVSGIALDTTPQHQSKALEAADPWRCLHRDQLSPEAIAALQRFYAADWAFLELAHQHLGQWPEQNAAQPQAA